MANSCGISALGKCIYSLTHALQAASVYLASGSPLKNRYVCNRILMHVETQQRKASYVTILYGICKDEDKDRYT